MSETQITKEIFNATTQQVETAVLTVDSANEIIATFSNDAFLKFPAGLTADELETQIAAIQESSEDQDLITEESQAAAAEETQASQSLIEQVGTVTPIETNEDNTMSEGDETNVPTPTDSTPSS